METVIITKEEYKQLKKQAKIDMDLMQQLVGSIKDIKEGRIKRVR